MRKYNCFPEVQGFPKFLANLYINMKCSYLLRTSIHCNGSHVKHGLYLRKYRAKTRFSKYYDLRNFNFNLVLGFMNGIKSQSIIEER